MRTKSNVKNLMVGGVIGLFALSACSNNEDMYDPEMAEKLLKAEYKANFCAKFGYFDANYSWDATSAYPQYGSTRAISYEPTCDKDKYYDVESGTLDWLKDKLKDGQYNRDLGTPFIMTVPNNPFTIVPIYQGTASMEWDLHVVVGDVDTKVWSKSEGLEYKGKEGSDWEKVENSTVNAHAVRANYYTFDLKEVAGKTMYFYLEITKGEGNYAETGTKQSSLNGMMLALQDCPRPGNIKEGNEVMIIGCEDANLSGSDWDLNDIVFLVYGDPKVPQPVEIENNEIPETTTKRYMIEDLGSTDDFDFNDIVVDVTRERTKRITIVNGKVEKEEYIDEKQEAVIRHLGGTLPFSLTIGDTQFEQMDGQMDMNPNTVREITGWEPETNNISVNVKGKNSENIYIEFPKDGEVPMIIAVNPDVKWMEERVSITLDWFNSIRGK